jgi:hypothetical protein
VTSQVRIAHLLLAEQLDEEAFGARIVGLAEPENRLGPHLWVGIGASDLEQRVESRRVIALGYQPDQCWRKSGSVAPA